LTATSCDQRRWQSASQPSASRARWRRGVTPGEWVAAGALRRALRVPPSPRLKPRQLGCACAAVTRCRRASARPGALGAHGPRRSAERPERVRCRETTAQARTSLLYLPTYTMALLPADTTLPMKSLDLRPGRGGQDGALAAACRGKPYHEPAQSLAAGAPVQLKLRHRARKVGAASLRGRQQARHDGTLGSATPKPSTAQPACGTAPASILPRPLAAPGVPDPRRCRADPRRPSAGERTTLTPCRLADPCANCLRWPCPVVALCGTLPPAPAGN